ncbi:MAG: sulfatase-like hydrolase/transferase [Propionibacterium sp.]|nr:sulfatase-like hydrolase/transferase [Propionibacterium sp.]
MATIARILQANGYATAAFGKMHQTPAWETSAQGPFHRWPTGDGFDRFYGFLGAETNQFRPNLIDGTTRIEPPKTPEEGYHFSEDIVERSIDWIESLDALEPGRPWFSYISYGAVHDPLQVPPGWREKYAGRFAEGWDAQRERILARQKELGLVPEHTTLSDWYDGVPRWEDLDETRRVVAERLMETYAAMAEHADVQTLRLVETLERLGQLDNTLIFYVLGDNGASAEGGLEGTLNQVIHMNHLTDNAERIHERLDEIGGPDSYCHYPTGWALALNTPYRFAKQVASHYGGTRNGLIVHWPAGINAGGELRHQWHHVIDVVPTILQAAGLPAPEVVDGHRQDPIEGTAMNYSFNEADAADQHTTQYFEIFGNRGVYHRGWTAVTVHKIPWIRGVQLPPFEADQWELYNVEEDWSQLRDLSAEYPEKLAELQELFRTEAEKYHVFPLDDRLNERFVPSLANRHTLLGERTDVTFTPNIGALPEDVAPNVKNRTFTLTVDFEADESANGVLVAQGGRFGGWSLYLMDGCLRYAYNYVDMEHWVVASEQRIGPGHHEAVLQFDYDGGDLGLGADVTLSVDGVEVAAGRIPKTLKFNFSIDETMDFGADRGTAVTTDYVEGPGNAFTGAISRIRFQLGTDHGRVAFEERAKAKLAGH